MRTIMQVRDGLHTVFQLLSAPAPPQLMVDTGGSLLSMAPTFCCATPEPIKRCVLQG